MQGMFFSRWFAKRLICLVVVTLLFAYLLGMVISNATGSSSSWSIPETIAIRKVSATTSAQAEPNLLNNLNCTPLTYRLASTSTMRTGCFTETAFGLMDSDSEVVIFNGTDEGLPLLPYVSGQILVPWPKSGSLLSLITKSTDGDYIGLYKNPEAILQDQRDYLGRLTGEQLTRAPDITLKDASGIRLNVNAQTLAFSENGAWLVAETVSNAFVRINLATLSVTPFAPAYGAQGGPSSLKSRVSITDDGRYVAISNEAAQAFNIYDLSVCNGQHAPQCPHYDYRTFIKQRIASLQRIGHLRFVNGDLLSFDAFGGKSEDTGTYEISPTPHITSLTDYLGLGDSYTSGEGAFDYLDGTDTADNMCHLSRLSYPFLLTHDLFSTAGGHSVACSGAVIRDIGDTSSSYRGQVKGVPSLDELQEAQMPFLETVEANFLPGYIAQQRFVGRWQPAIATVSVGGDDIGFGDILERCVAPHLSQHSDANTCYRTYEDRLELIRLIDRTVPRWVSLFSQLRREAPATRFYAIGYPQLADPTGKCGVNVQLNRAELSFSVDVINYLNLAIQTAADKAGVDYIDITHALAGHRLCEAAGYDVALNGVTAGTDAGFFGLKLFGKESYHPNTLGQALIEQAILQQTHNFTGERVTPSETPDPTSLLAQAPVTGRTLYTVVPSRSLASSVVKRGSPTTIYAAYAASGIASLRANTQYAVHLDGPSGEVLGVLMSSSEGNIGESSVVIPANTTPGIHTMDLVGRGQVGTNLDVTQPVYVRAGETDSDGDGIEDSLDSCPGAVNSRQDADGDGVDDICDRVISSLIPGDTSGTGKGSGQPHGTATSSTISTHAIMRQAQVLAARTGHETNHHDQRSTRSTPHATSNISAVSGMLKAALLLTCLALGVCCWLIITKTYTKNRRFPLQ